MANMATPWKHLTTGFYDLRRQIAGRMLPAFGGTALLDVSLKRRAPPKPIACSFKPTRLRKQQFEEIRVRIKATGEPLPSRRDRVGDIIAAYFDTLVAIAPKTKSCS
jgi:hypothetical protein